MKRSLVIGAAFVLCSCASTAPPVQSMRDPQANYGAFTPFSWQNSGTAAGEPPISILENWPNRCCGGRGRELWPR